MEQRRSDMPVIRLAGVGKSTSEKLSKLGVYTLRDLVDLFPRAYEYRGNVISLSEAAPDIRSSFFLTVLTDVKTTKAASGIKISKFKATDGAVTCEVIFFNSPYVKDVFYPNTQFRFSGKLTFDGKKIKLINPTYEPYIEGIPLPDYIPIYPLTAGISSKQIDKLVKVAFNEIISEINDPLPEEIRLKNTLPTLQYALKNSHFPENEQALKASLRRLAFDEMLIFGLSASLRERDKHIKSGIRFKPCSIKPITDPLPYELTRSQKQAINDIYADMVTLKENDTMVPMSRILVGDVGCGKTVCAVIAMYIAAASGYQSALMVPTEILARQHYNETEKLLGKLGIRVKLLIGSMSKKEKDDVYSSIQAGEADIVIGTHALISENVNFNDLALVITDEQHRFGVMQRAKLKEKGKAPHLLVMSATPIPRSLALTMYGDLDITRMTDMPSGRQRVDTFLVNESYRARVNDFIRKQVLLGGQCYIVCPSIDGDEDNNIVFAETVSNVISNSSLNLKNVTEYSEKLKKDLPDLSIGVLHGRMRAFEKEEVMSDFANGNIKVLISTTVIEVGVNVPNATLMIIENAERFGLSQLHQLRGRVGRGMKKSYCILISDSSNEKTVERLNVMKLTNDGFKIAERDLELRGPGDFFSSNVDSNFRQSGGFKMKFASMCDDNELFSDAFSAARTIVSDDPDLSKHDHSELKKIIFNKYNSSSTIS